MDELSGHLFGIREFLNLNSGYVMNITIMVFGIIASFLTACIRKKTQITGILLLAGVFDLITAIVYGTGGLFWLTVLFSVVLAGICLLLICKREIVSRSKIDRMIRRFTEDADHNSPLCIFGGDLDFFGNVEVGEPVWKDRFQKNRNIRFNKQYSQIKRKGFREINILSVRPYSDNESDRKTRLRIGFLISELGNIIKIKFFEEKECHSCPDRSTCVICDMCLNCAEYGICTKNKKQTCGKMEEYIKDRCYNPDTKLRGRLLTLQSTAALSAAIVTTYKAGRSYILKEYSSNTNECSMYQKIWNVWWKKCKTDEVFIRQCMEEYSEFINRKTEKGRVRT